MSKILLMTAMILLAGCATVRRGTIGMKIDDQVAHVALNRGEVQVGDHVELYANVCPGKRGGEDFMCKKVSKGHGVVTKVLNDHYSEVEFEKGIIFKEGDFVEKHGH